MCSVNPFGIAGTPLCRKRGVALERWRAVEYLREEYDFVMGDRIQSARIKSPALLVGLTLWAVLSCLAQAQQRAKPMRLPFTVADQQAYLDDLIRNAPSTWKHGKNWTLIDPYVLGRSVSQPSTPIICPDLGHADAFNDSNVDLPPWIYAASDACDELSASRDSAVLVLEDPKDNDAAYFLFLVCDVKRSRNHCDVAPSAEGYGMKLEESNKAGNRAFDVLAETTDNKSGRFSVAEVWHLRNVTAEASENLTRCHSEGRRWSARRISLLPGDGQTANKYRTAPSAVWGQSG